MKDVQRHTYYRVPSVTGANTVLVSIRFGQPSDKGIAIVFRAAIEGLTTPTVDIQRYVSEIEEGVATANEEMEAYLEIEEIEIVPTDSPTPGMVRDCAHAVALRAIEDIES